MLCCSALRLTAARGPRTSPLACGSVLALGLLIGAASGCLPGDERPEPGSVELNVQQSDAVAGGFTTDDGWTVTFDRFITTLGGTGLTNGFEIQDNPDCVDYSLSFYSRLYDFTAVTGPSKVVLHYGLGHCWVPFSLRQPSTELTLLMAGVTAADRDAMIPENAGPFGFGGDEPGIALWLKGRATRAGVTKRFDWPLRVAHGVTECRSPAADEVLNTVDLRSGEAHVLNLEIRPEELFRLTPSRAAPIELDRFAAADEDGDGVITLDELDTVEVDFSAVIEDLLDELPNPHTFLHGVGFPDELSAFEGLAEGEDLQDKMIADLPEPLRAAITAFLLGYFDPPTLRTLVHILSQRIAAFTGAGECVFTSLRKETIGLEPDEDDNHWH